MKKVSLVVMEREREESLKKLRGLGVIHLEKKNISSQLLSELLEQKTKTEKALGILHTYALNKKNRALEKTSGAESGRADPGIGIDSLIAEVIFDSEKRKSLQENLAALARERDRTAEWGDFDSPGISLIEEKLSAKFFFYRIFSQRLDNIPKDIKYIVLGTDKNFTRLVVLDSEIPGAYRFVPGLSLGQIRSQIEQIKNQLADIESRIGILARSYKLAEDEYKNLLSRIEFESAKAGMDILENVPENSTVSWINGFIPQEDMGILKREAAENSWALIASDPGPDDAVPTKLRNNRLVSLVNPLMEFLNIVPGYNEADVSGWFLFFFTIFFGMIYGDAVYGAAFIIIAIVGIFKSKSTIFKLTLLLGSSTFIWGVLTCSWLGMDTAKLPLLLQKISLPAISGVTASKSAWDEGIVRQNLMIFCFSLGLLQCSIGHIIRITRTRSLVILADIGSIGMLTGMYGIILSLIASNESRQIPLYMPFFYTFGAGFLLNFVFANYRGSIGKSVLEGLKNIISAILSVGNTFGDIMSYIRLWAVGLAGAAIASTVNFLAGGFLSHLIFFVVAVVIIILGHSLNFVLNALSVLVHGVRLNILEFSGHVGLTWSGIAYRPFRETVKTPSDGKS